jgi:organic radical activating enzyme
MNNEERVEELKRRTIWLNQVSPTFCLAKWLTSTTTLYNGMTHSCHHPRQHKISMIAVQAESSELHNTPEKVQARLDMRNGIQTPECDYCWNIENLGKEHFSDRHYKSANEETGVWQRRDEIVNGGIDTADMYVVPSYFEVAFENICNFKCSYCSPDVSSLWMSEIQQHGPYKLSYEHHNLDWLRQTGRFPIHHREHNPYIDAFWRWWPELYPKLHTFRITGGEPLLSKNTWRVLHEIEQNPRKDLNFEINTNLGVPSELVVKLVHQLNNLAPKIGNIVVYTSAESTGEQAEYSRFGMDWNLFEQNVEILLNESKHKIVLTFMTTVNILSASTFDDFLYWITSLREKYTHDKTHNRVRFTVSYLRWPQHQSITLLDDSEKRAFEARLKQAVADCTNPNLFVPLYLEEQDQIQRLIDFMWSTDLDPMQLRDFRRFFDEYDRRRNTSLLKTFPELRTVYQIGGT